MIKAGIYPEFLDFISSRHALDAISESLSIHPNMFALVKVGKIDRSCGEEGRNEFSNLR